VGNVVEFGLADVAQVGALGAELAQQAVGALVAAALLGSLQIAEPDVDFQPSR